MIQWGINALNHGSSLAVFNRGELVMFDSRASDELDMSTILSAIRIGDPSNICWYERPWIKKVRQLRAGQYKTAFNMSTVPSRYLARTGLYADMLYAPHHASHAAAGYYTSPFNHAAVVVLDAIGEFECASIWDCKDGEMRKVWSRSYPNSLGLFYSAFTKLVGLEPLKQEYLLQEMSKQGDPRRYYREVKSYIDNTLMLTRNLHRGVLDWAYEINNLQTQCDIAASVQLVFEEQVASVMGYAKLLTGADSLVYMGGCAMNSKANIDVVKQWDYVWSLPNPGDPSSSIGAVLYHTKQRVWDYKWDPVKHIEIKI